MEDPLSYQLIIIAVLLVFSALFSASETAFTSLSIANRKAIEELKTRASKRTIWLVRKPDLLLTTIL
ncbi:MAG: CNNM domain-containing protein, partial [Sphaerochaetaceae bacterium]|nr:CNNM domain-containing protein [Sphaerochaetaceae bacterium]